MQASMDSPSHSTRLGEVIESSSAEVTIQCYELHGGAPLGSLVRTEESELFAVVRNIITEPIDPARRPVARGQDEPDQAALYRSNPQLGKLLHTVLQATIVGHRTGDEFHQYLPTLPPKIHAFVQTCEFPEVLAFTRTLDFLPLLLLGSVPMADEVTAAFLRLAAEVHEDRNAFLTKAGTEVARLLGRDLQRLNAFLRRIHP